MYLKWTKTKNVININTKEILGSDNREKRKTLQSACLLCGAGRIKGFISVLIDVIRALK